MEKYAKLIMVAVNSGKGAAQSNKYYEMEWDGVSSNFNVKYGRVESTQQTASYSHYDWDKKYNEKIKKGYKDVTHLVSTTTVVDNKKTTVKLDKISDNDVETFVSLMEKYTKNLVSTTYSVKASSVTQAQLDEAQRIIDKLVADTAKKVSQVKTNELLIELYMVIPRYMGNVPDHLLPNIKLDKVLIQEQDNLDAMASQVDQYKKTTAKASADEKKGTVLDVMGITMTKADKNPKDIEYLVKQLTGKQIQAVFEVKREKSEKAFDKWMSTQKNKKTSLLLHGTRCSSVLPILEQGLKIRPAGNYQFSGKAYGEGNYFSEVCAKSLGYTGYDNDIVLLVFEVHTGNPFKYDGWYRGNSFSLNYKELSSRGFDSTYVNAGNGLLNSEIIAYKEDQCRPRYIIHLKR